MAGNGGPPPWATRHRRKALPVEYDAAVVGAGPAGSTAARDLAAAGFRVLLLEEHAQVGRRR